MGQAIGHILQNHEPYPAFAFDRLWVLAYSNQAATRLFDRCCAPGEPRNIMRIMLAPGPMKDMIANWADVARAVLVRLRRQVYLSDGDAQLAALYSEAQNYLRGAGIEFSAPDSPYCTMQMRLGGQLLNVYTTHSSVGGIQDLGAHTLTLEHMFPENEAAEEYFRAEARGIGQTGTRAEPSLR